MREEMKYTPKMGDTVCTLKKKEKRNLNKKFMKVIYNI